MTTLENIKLIINTNDIEKLVGIKDSLPDKYVTIENQAHIYSLKGMISNAEFLNVVRKLNAIKEYKEAERKAKKVVKYNTDDLMIEFMRSKEFSYSIFYENLSEEDKKRFPNALSMLKKGCSSEVLSIYSAYINQCADNIISKLVELNDDIIKGKNIDLIDYYDLIPYDPVYIRRLLIGHDKIDLRLIYSVMFKKETRKEYNNTKWRDISLLYLKNDENFYKFRSTISQADRLAVYKYMEDNNYPLCMELFDSFIYRLINHDLAINEPKVILNKELK